MFTLLLAWFLSTCARLSSPLTRRAFSGPSQASPLAGGLRDSPRGGSIGAPPARCSSCSALSAAPSSAARCLTLTRNPAITVLSVCSVTFSRHLLVRPVHVWYILTCHPVIPAYPSISLPVFLCFVALNVSVDVSSSSESFLSPVQSTEPTKGTLHFC